MALRDSLKATVQTKYGIKLSFMPFFIKVLLFTQIPPCHAPYARLPLLPCLSFQCSTAA